VVARSKSWIVFARSDTNIVNSNPTWGMDICVRLFCVYAILCVQVAVLRHADPRPRSPTDCVKDQENEKAATAQ
jgi:hypothetical protein